MLWLWDLFEFTWQGLFKFVLYFLIGWVFFVRRPKPRKGDLPMVLGMAVLMFAFSFAKSGTSIFSYAYGFFLFGFGATTVLFLRIKIRYRAAVLVILAGLLAASWIFLSPGKLIYAYVPISLLSLTAMLFSRSIRKSGNDKKDFWDDPRLITPPDFKEISEPVIFLMGPIQGAREWQRDAAYMIWGMNKDIRVACPRRKFFSEKFDYDTQVDWETAYLNRAAENGAILCWLEREHTHYCERAYAQTTRFELGEWKSKYEANGGINLVVGIDEGFSNGRYILKRLSDDCPDVPIAKSLKEACEKAVEKILERSS